MENILGKRIEMERVRIGINQIELAKRLNLSSSASISQYESGERTPSDDIKLKMCEIFNCSLDYLVGRTDIRNPEQQEDPFGLAKIGFSMKDYNPPTETQKAQIEELIKVIMKDNKKEN
jgi:transcriptional regulator with XRE-family HTH domain